MGRYNAKEKADLVFRGNMVDVNRAVIPVAGMGTRLLPVSKSQPKEMLPLGRKPCVQHIVEEVAAAGCSDILFITVPIK